MSRIASFFVAAALVLTAAPVFAQGGSPSLQAQAYDVAFSLQQSQSEVKKARAELNTAWAQARAVKSELTELRSGAEATSSEGQERIHQLTAEMAVAKMDIKRLTGNRAQAVAQRQQLRGEQSEIQVAMAKARRSKNSSFASSRSVNRAFRGGATAHPAAARWSH